MQTIEQTWTGKNSFTVPGGYFRLLSTVNAVDVVFYLKGQEVGRALQMQAGLAADGIAFDRVDITTGGAETVKFIVSDSPIRYDRMTGDFVVSGSVGVSGITNQVTPTNTQKTVTSASAQLIAANAARRFLIVQNKDAAGRIWLYFGAAAATKANGLLLEPGAGIELNDCVPTTEIRAIGDAASNPNVVVMEG